MRDLVALGFDVEQLALRISRELEVETPRIRARVNVVEVVAPEAMQAAVERLFEEWRPTGPLDLRIHPVADLVGWTPEELEARQAECREMGVETDAIEPTEPFEIDSLVEVIEQTRGEGVARVTPQGRNLVVLGTPAAQRRISEFLDDLRAPGPPDNQAQ